MSEPQTEKIGCIPEATIAGIPVDKSPIDDSNNVELPPPGTSVVAFISKLYELVNNPETQNFICWSNEFNKKAIMIPDPVEFSKQILPKFFKHSNICSFVRQLNIYGFRKLETQTGFCFRHESFIAGHPELLPNIQRKKPTPHRKKQPGDDTTSLYQYLLTQLMQLQKQNVETQTQINTLKEMLYQLKMREDTLEMKLYRLSETVMPSLNYGSMAFNPSLLPQMVNQQNTSSTTMSNGNDAAMSNFSSLINFSTQNAVQQPSNQQTVHSQTSPQNNGLQTPNQTQQLAAALSQWNQQKNSEEQPQPSSNQQGDSNGFVQWDFQSQIPWKF
ncbi:heat shock transcription factor, putative [Entamoeba histolytica KU27]|nr:heat shock transcription factor, putative [Entamoeba histolytica KU27]